MYAMSQVPSHGLEKTKTSHPLSVTIASKDPSVILKLATEDKLRKIDKNSEDYPRTAGEILSLIKPYLNSLGFWEKGALGIELGTSHVSMLNKLNDAAQITNDAKRETALKKIWEKEQQEVIKFINEAVPKLVRKAASKMTAAEALRIAGKIEAIQ